MAATLVMLAGCADKAPTTTAAATPAPSAPAATPAPPPAPPYRPTPAAGAAVALDPALRAAVQPKRDAFDRCVTAESDRLATAQAGADRGDIIRQALASCAPQRVALEQQLYDSGLPTAYIDGYVGAVSEAVLAKAGALLAQRGRTASARP